MSDSHQEIQPIAKLLQEWQARLDQSRDQIGRSSASSRDDRPLGAASALDGAAPVGRPGLWDGEKTTQVMVDSLAAWLSNHLEKQGPEAWNDAQTGLVQASTRLITWMGAPQMKAYRPGLTIRPSPLLSDLRHWLLGQDLPGSQMVPRRGIDDRLPFVVLSTASGQRTLSRLGGLWLDGGLSRLLLNTAQLSPFWDARRGQLSYDRPHILLYSGILDVNSLKAKLTSALSDEGATALIVLADAIDLEQLPEALQKLPVVVLPAPQGSEDLKTALSIAGGKGWALGRLRAAQIDERRAVLLLPEGVALKTPPSSEPFWRGYDWRTLDVALLEVLEQEASNIAEAEMAMNWRIEAEEGIVADGGATLAWLAEHVPSEGDPYALAWQTALRQPLRQILRNRGASAHEPAILTWVTGSDGPWRAYEVLDDQDEKDAWRTVPCVKLGHCLDLGAVTSREQIRRMLRQTTATALQQARLMALARLAEQ